MGLKVALSIIHENILFSRKITAARKFVPTDKKRERAIAGMQKKRFFMNVEKAVVLCEKNLAVLCGKDIIGIGFMDGIVPGAACGFGDVLRWG